MRTIARASTLAAATVMVLGLAAPAFAAPGDNGQGVGGCIDQLYGNATNPRPSGHGVLPSQSPGPWVNNPSDPSNPTWGPSVGALIQEFGGNPGLLQGSC